MKIAWAFNPFDDNPKLHRTALAIVRRLGRAPEPVEVIYVASPGEPQLAVAFDVPVNQRYTKYPEQLIERAMRRFGVANASITVLSQRTPSLTACARMLAAYLGRHRVDLTILASHARTGLPRLMLGSFAEILVHLAKTDLLVINDACRVRRTPKALLFAHDLSPAGDRGLRRAIEYARSWGCDLHIVHVPLIAHSFSLGGSVEAETYHRRIRQKMSRVEAVLRRAGINGSAVIQTQAHPVAEQIVRSLASVRGDLLLVVGKSGQFAGWLGGSVTRKLLRTAPVPVLVIKG